MGPRVGLDRCGISRPPQGFDPRTVQPVDSRYTDCTIPAHPAVVGLCKKLRNYYNVDGRIILKLILVVTSDDLNHTLTE